MAIAASGAVSFSDLRTEFVGGSSAISLGDLYRGGSNILSKAGDNTGVNLAASVPTSGAINIGNFHSTAKGFKFTYSSDASNQNFSTVFGDDYDVNYPKIVDISSGVSVYGTNTHAITIPSGLAGGLTLNNAGTVYGYGGAANGGAGGNCISCATSGVTINNSANLFAGGGGGGQGGTGGGGSYVTTSYSYSRGTYDWVCNANGTCFVHLVSISPMYHCHCMGYCWMSTSDTTCTIGGVLRRKGSLHTTDMDGDNNVTAYRYYLGTDSTNSTNGGTGGNGGVGQGYNQSAGTGVGGAAGGTSAGAGGTGGNGASYGQAGATGGTGSNGNASNGLGGSAGGAAGAAVAGTSVTMNNTGTIHGAVA